MKRLFAPRPLPILVLAALCSVFSFLPAAPARADAYHATVLLREEGLPPRPCGTVAVDGAKARIDVQFGNAGLIYVIVRPEQKAMYAVAENLKTYAVIPLRGDEKDMRDYAARVADSLVLLGAPMLSIREEGAVALGEGRSGAYTARRVKSRFVADFMGTVSSICLIAWENSSLTPFPLRMEKIRSLQGEELTGDSVELTGIRPGGNQDAAFFDPPAGFARAASVLELIVYVLAHQ